MGTVVRNNNMKRFGLSRLKLMLAIVIVGGGVIARLCVRIVEPVVGDQLPCLAHGFVGVLHADGRLVQEFVGQALR